MDKCHILKKISYFGGWIDSFSKNDVKETHHEIAWEKVSHLAAHLCSNLILLGSM